MKEENGGPNFGVLLTVVTLVILAIVGIVVVAIAIANSMGLTSLPALI